jgi:hypothetical protein
MWRAIGQDALLEMINNAEWLMPSPVKAFWDRIKIAPEKWRQSPWGDDGGGFWVVALIGRRCIYYNDIEDGFNFSEFDCYGQIKTYGCSQSDLLSFMNSYYKDFIEAIF